MLMAGIAAMLADPTPPVDEQPAAPVATDEDVVATATFTMSNNGESSEKLCTMRRGQDAAAAAVSFAEAHQVNAEGLLQIAQHMAGLSVAGYEPPKELRLRTAGAHKKKAEALSKDGAHDEAAEHVLRALLRPGLEESVMAQLKAQLERAMAKLVQRQASNPYPNPNPYPYPYPYPHPHPHPNPNPNPNPNPSPSPSPSPSPTPDPNP